MEKIEFANTDISGVLDRLPEESFSRLPFGLVKLDSKGTILAYNMAEAEISGIRPEDVIGKNFFLDVAVCTQRPEFYGKFREAMDNHRVLNLIFDYTFQNALYAPVHEPVRVRVHMVSSKDIKGETIVWLMVKRVGAAPPAPIVRAAEVVPHPAPRGPVAVTESSRAPEAHDELGDILIRFDDVRRAAAEPIGEGRIGASSSARSAESLPRLDPRGHARCRRPGFA